MALTPMMISLKVQDNGPAFVSSTVTEFSVLDPTRDKMDQLFTAAIGYGTGVEGFKQEWNRLTEWINGKHGAGKGVLWMGHRIYEKNRALLQSLLKKVGLELSGHRSTFCDTHRIANCIRFGKDNELKDYRCMLGLPRAEDGSTMDNVRTIWKMLRRFGKDNNIEKKSDLFRIFSDCKWASPIAKKLKPNDLDIEVFVYDTETTGLPVDGVYPHIVQFSALAPHRPHDREWFDEFVQPPKPVEEGAEKVHGISNQVLKSKRVWAQVYPDVREFLTPKKLADKIIMLGYNNKGFRSSKENEQGVMESKMTGFDVNVLMSECDRIGFDLRRNFTPQGSAEIIHFCALKQFDLYGMILSLFKGMYKKADLPQKFFTLINMASFFDVGFEGAAHNSKWDVLATWKVFQRVTEKMNWNVVKNMMDGTGGQSKLAELIHREQPNLKKFMEGKLLAITQPSVPKVISEEKKDDRPKLELTVHKKKPKKKLRKRERPELVESGGGEELKRVKSDCVVDDEGDEPLVGSGEELTLFFKV